MTRGVPFPRKCCLLLTVGAIAAVSCGAANAITSNNFTYGSPKTGYFTIHPMALSPNDETSGADYFISFEGGSLEGTGCFNTGINLPHGAKLVNVRVFFRSDDQSDVDIRIHRHTLADGTDAMLVDEPFADDSDTRTSVAFPIGAAHAVVNNRTFIYGFAVCVGAGTLFYGARFKYTYTNAGD